MTVAERVRGHRNSSKSKNTPVARWIRKRQKVISHRVLEVVTDGNWQERERFWIEIFTGQTPPLLNILKGGEGSHFPMFTPEHRQKISAALKTGWEKPCEECGEPFYAIPSVVALGRDRFCSIGCSNRAKGRLFRGVPRGPNWGAIDAAAAARRARTHCKRGHEFAEENTRLVSGRRVCRTCGRAAMAAYRAALKERVDAAVNSV